MTGKNLKFSQQDNSLLLIITTILLLVICSIPSGKPAHAQEQYPWPAPLEIPSDGDAIISNHTIIADQYGYVHLFWFESGGVDTRMRVMYSRYDGQFWSTPNDVFVSRPFAVPGDLSASVDYQGLIHLMWVDTGNVYYSFAPVQDALSAGKWFPPTQIEATAKEIRLRIDTNSILHVLYTASGVEAGVYYIRSEDGMSWSDPELLDPDKPLHYDPRPFLNFEIDEQDGLYAVWYYYDIRENRDDWVRFAHSLDGGMTWSIPRTIDQDNENTGKLTLSGPVLMVSAEQIHIVWGARRTEGIKRLHSYSTDRGLTWSQPGNIFGDLEGQASDGMAVDGTGRIHFLGQVRYPQGIYHAYWDKDRWVRPELIYLIARDAFEPMGSRIHAHYVRPVFRLGNQLVVNFTPEPPSINALYIMQRYLGDMPTLSPELLPTPSSVVPDALDLTSSSEISSGNSTPPTPAPFLMLEEQELTNRVQSMGSILFMGLLPGLLFVCGIIYVIWFRRRA